MSRTINRVLARAFGSVCVGICVAHAGVARPGYVVVAMVAAIMVGVSIGYDAGVTK